MTFSQPRSAELAGRALVTRVASSKSAKVTRLTRSALLASASTKQWRVWRMERRLTSASAASGVVKPSSRVMPLAPQKPSVKW